MDPKIAYVSPEFALTDDLPIFAGGLGVLAGDILHQAADSKVPLVGITVFYREGFFQQLINPKGEQKHFYKIANPEEVGLKNTGELIKIPLVDHELYLKIWKKEVKSPQSGNTVQLYLLDADIPENRPEDRKISDRLYERVWAPHLIDDLVLGIGSVRLIRKLGIPIETWHINDDHGGFNTVERIREYIARGMVMDEALEKVKSETIFTTHTTVAGAESKFSKEDLMPVLTSLFADQPADLEKLYELGKREWGGKEIFSLTVFMMRQSRKINAVSKKHFRVSKKLWEFIGEDIPQTFITNAVYSPRWTAPELDAIWRLWKFKEVWQNGGTVLKSAKLQAKKRTAQELVKVSLDSKTFDPEALVICWARRFAKYKQPNLLISDIQRLAKIITNKDRPVYILISGKAHPEDVEGQNFVKNIVEASRDPSLENHLIYLPNYGLKRAIELLSAADVWLNTPVIGWEASGTSGMKAVFNAALNASTGDGWWLEGFNGKNGWMIEPDGEDYATPTFDLIEKEIVPIFYDDPEKWGEMLEEAYRSCGARFDTTRMMEEYTKLYTN